MHIKVLEFQPLNHHIHVGICVMRTYTLYTYTNKLCDEYEGSDFVFFFRFMFTLRDDDVRLFWASICAARESFLTSSNKPNNVINIFVRGFLFHLNKHKWIKILNFSRIAGRGWILSAIEMVRLNLIVNVRAVADATIAEFFFIFYYSNKVHIKKRTICSLNNHFIEK